ncbi:hypothetical protein Tco_1409147 [Tanacetum coccineum]
MELAVDWSMQEYIVNGSPISKEDTRSLVERKKCLMVVGVNIALSSRKRRGETRKKLDEEKDILIRLLTFRSEKILFNLTEGTKKVDDRARVTHTAARVGVTYFDARYCGEVLEQQTLSKSNLAQQIQ